MVVPPLIENDAVDVAATVVEAPYSFQLLLREISIVFII